MGKTKELQSIKTWCRYTKYTLYTKEEIGTYIVYCILMFWFWLSGVIIFYVTHILQVLFSQVIKYANGLFQ